MANNRLYLRCSCGADYLLANGFAEWRSVLDADALGGWLNEHRWCEGAPLPLGPGNQTISIVYEHQSDPAPRA